MDRARIARVVLRVGVSLALGAATTVAVVVGLARYMPSSISTGSPPETTYRFGTSELLRQRTLVDRAGTTVYSSYRMEIGALTATSKPGVWLRTTGWEAPSQIVISDSKPLGFSRINERVADATGSTEYQFGFPFRALWTMNCSEVSGCFLTDHGFTGWRAFTASQPARGYSRATGPGYQWGVPTNVIVGGFAGDSAVFGAGWYGVIAGVVTIRNRRMIRAGQCVKCRYDRRGLPEGAVCPECGAAV